MAAADLDGVVGAAARRAAEGFRARPRGIAVPAATLALIAGSCIIAPAAGLVPAPIGGNVLDAGLPLLSPGHPLGTDLNGNDVLSRVLHGGRASLGIAVAVNALGLVAGGLVGALGAYAGRAADAVVMRLCDVLIAFPTLVLVIAVAQALGPGYGRTILALAFFSVPAFARLARAATLRLREQPFVVAAELAGASAPSVLMRHLVPNLLPQLATFALLGIGFVVTIEGALGFVGFGVPLPQPSWGNMIFQGQQSILTQPSLVCIPGAFLFITVLACNLLGERLRAAWSVA